MPPSSPIVAIVDAFRSEFTAPTWTKVLVLLWGTILARGPAHVNGPESLRG